MILKLRRYSDVAHDGAVVFIAVDQIRRLEAKRYYAGYGPEFWYCRVHLADGSHIEVLETHQQLMAYMNSVAVSFVPDDV